jgi:hypothetical protein
MALNVELSNLLEDGETRGIFEAVAQPRTILVRDLKTRFPNKVLLNQTISRLKNAALIKEMPSVIEDFNTLYVTADGLSAVKALQQRSF